MCSACARDLVFAVTCSDACERDCTELQEINRRAKRIYGVGDVPRQFPLAAAIWGAFAVLFVGFGIYDFIHTAQMYWFPVLFGLLSGGISVVAYRRAKALQLNL